jgi:hypothetical protein
VSLPDLPQAERRAEKASEVAVRSCREQCMGIPGRFTRQSAGTQSAGRFARANALIDRLDPLCGNDGMERPLVSGPRGVVAQSKRELSFAPPLVASAAVYPYL